MGTISKLARRLLGGADEPSHAAGANGSRASEGGAAMKTAMEWAASLSTDSTLADDERVIAAAMADARRDERERCDDIAYAEFCRCVHNDDAEGKDASERILDAIRALPDPKEPA